MHPSAASSSSLTTIERVLLSALSVPVVVVLVSYALDAAGLPFRPWPMLGVALAAAAGVLIAFRGDAAPSARADLLTVTGVLAPLTIWTLWLAWPSLLPLSSGPDLTHHLLLIGFVERHWRLVHDLALERFLGEMTQYTPGSHVLSALAGAWMGKDGLHAMHPVQCGALTLKAGLLTAIALRSLPSRAPRVLAAVPVILLLSTPRYFLGGFTEYGFLAQSIAEVFVIGMWWMLVAWDSRPDRRLTCAFGCAAAAAFLSWPVYTGAPVLAGVGLIALNTRMPVVRRAQHLMLALSPLVIVAGTYLIGRLGWLQLAGTGGTAPTPSLANLGSWLIALGIPGIALLAFNRARRASFIFAAAVALEAAAFLVLARRSHAPQPYMALKMVYLLVWPAALGGALTVYAIWTQISYRVETSTHAMRAIASRNAIAAGLVVAMLVAVAVPLWRQPRLLHPRTAATSEPLNQSATWVRANLPVSCIEYLTGDEETAYWLHLAVLGNPRISARTGDNATYRLNDALVRWMTPGGLPYAIVDLNAVPADVRRELNIVRSFGTAVVARRRTADTCTEQP